MRGALVKFGDFARREWKLTLALSLLAAFLLWQFGASVADGFRGKAVAARVAGGAREAAVKVEEARDLAGAAAEAEVERRVEDRIREQAVKPEVERAERAVNVSRSRREEAEKKNEDKNNFRPVDTPPDALAERNCASLAELYPGERFPGCR